MQSNAKRVYRSTDSRQGLSIVELVGCLAALGGGVVIGSLYLGVDVKAMAVGILEQADIEVPALLTAEPPASSVSTSDEAVPAEVSASDETPVQDPVTASQEDSTAEAEAPLEPPVQEELTDAEKQLASLAAWAALDQSVQAEAANRSKPLDDTRSWQLYDYLLHRKQGHEVVVETIRQIDQDGIDQHLQAHITQVLAWHRTGVQLYDRAAQLLAGDPSGRLSSPHAQSWQSSATQHRMEEKLLANKHASIGKYLEHSQQ